MKNQNLIENLTALTTVSNIFVDNEAPLTMFVSGLATSENVKVQADIGGAFVDLYEDGSLVQMTTVNNTFTIYGSGVYQIVKSVTAGGATVSAFTRGNTIILE